MDAMVSQRPLWWPARHRNRLPLLECAHLIDVAFDRHSNRQHWHSRRDSRPAPRLAGAVSGAAFCARKLKKSMRASWGPGARLESIIVVSWQQPGERPWGFVGAQRAASSEQRASLPAHCLVRDSQPVTTNTCIAGAGCARAIQFGRLTCAGRWPSRMAASTRKPSLVNGAQSASPSRGAGLLFASSCTPASEQIWGPV